MARDAKQARPKLRLTSMHRFVGLAVFSALLIGCSREDDEKARQKLNGAKQELKHDVHEAAVEIKKDAHEAAVELKKGGREASRELKKGSDELKEKAQSK